MRFSKLIYFSLILPLSLTLGGGCEKTYDDVIPTVTVDFTINIDTDPDYISLQAVASSLLITQHPQGESSIGYDDNGVIVYHSEYRSVFYAFDATCPNCMPSSVALEVDGSVAVCPVCESKFMLPGEGVPTTGSESKYSLKEYNSRFYSDGTLYVYN